MTLTEMLVALTLLMIVIVGTTPVMLSSYDGLYQAGEKTQQSYNAKSEIEDTSKVFATDMLVLKLIQGLPVVGVVGGVFNPVYYNKIMNYVRLKYHKRYLLGKLNTI